MKTVYFIRHAKSCHDEDCKDIDRSISQKGEKNIKFMANLLKSKHIIPDIIISSSAKRTMQSAKIISNILEFKDEIIKKADLYNASLKDFLNIFYSIDSKFDNVFIIAHNPSITEICEFLSNSIIDHMPTSAIFCIEFKNDNFKDIAEHSGKVVFFDYPKLHKNR